MHAKAPLRHTLRITLTAATAAGTCLALACGSDSTDPGDPDPAPVATVALSATVDTLQAGSSTQLTATAKDADGNTLTGREASWTTDDAKIATVSASGLVTAVNKGTTGIQVTIEGIDKSAHITVVVGATGDWAGSAKAAGSDCPMRLSFDETLDGTIAGNGFVEEPCNESLFTLSGEHGVGGVADSVQLVLSFEDQGDLPLNGTFDGAGTMSGFLIQGPCTGTSCPWSFTRTSIVPTVTVLTAAGGVP